MTLSESQHRIMLADFSRRLTALLKEPHWRTADAMAYIAQAVPLLEAEWRELNHERTLLASLPADVLEQIRAMMEIEAVVEKSERTAAC